MQHSGSSKNAPKTLLGFPERWTIWDFGPSAVENKPKFSFLSDWGPSSSWQEELHLSSSSTRQLALRENTYKQPTPKPCLPSTQVNYRCPTLARLLSHFTLAFKEKKTEWGSISSWQHILRAGPAELLALTRLFQGIMKERLMWTPQKCKRL